MESQKKWKYQKKTKKQDSNVSDLQDLGRMIYSCVEQMQSKNIAHSMLFVPPGTIFNPTNHSNNNENNNSHNLFKNKKKHGLTVFIVPRKIQTTYTEFVVTPGFPDASGQPILIEKNDWFVYF